MKKKLVVGITIIVCLLFSLFIMGIFLVNQDEKSLKQLKNEIYSMDNIIENEGIFSNNIDKKLIDRENLNTLGSHTVIINLHKKVVAHLNVVLKAGGK